MEMRPTKSQVILLIKRTASIYMSYFNEFKAIDKGWLVWSDKFHEIKDNLKIHNYVTLYKNQRTIDLCLMVFLYGLEGFKELNSELSKLNQSEQQLYVEALVNELLDDDFEWVENMISSIHHSPEVATDSKAIFDMLSDAEKKDLILRKQFFFAHVFLSLHNYFSILVNGEKMVSLVPKAISGDDQAFCKAVRIDRSLLIHHPYFSDRYQRAQSKPDKFFLKKLAASQSTPNLVGRIKNPEIYLIFAMLENVGWLDDFKHNEILDLVEQAGFDRKSLNLTDVNCLTKHLIRYRRYQKTGGVSMH